MLAPVSQSLTIRVTETETVSALFTRPQQLRACYVLAHGAGAGMHHIFMAAVSTGLCDRGIATLRDELADVALMRTVTAPLGQRATLQFFDDADHSFHVRARSGRTDQQVLDSMLDATVAWITAR